MVKVVKAGDPRVVHGDTSMAYISVTNARLPLRSAGVGDVAENEPDRLVEQTDQVAEQIALVLRNPHLMHFVEAAVADPSPDNVVALRKAFWRNRDSEDFDPHYADRYW